MVTAMTIAETLGGRSVLKERLADYTAVIDRARSGLPFASLAAVGTRYDIPLLTLARVVGLPARTLARRKKERRLRADESDRLAASGARGGHRRGCVGSRTTRLDDGSRSRTAPWAASSHSTCWTPISAPRKS